MSSIILRPTAIANQDLLHNLLQNKHKESTRKTYISNLSVFAKFLTTNKVEKGSRANIPNLSSILEEFVKLPKLEALNLFQSFKNKLIEAAYAPNSINLKLAAIRSLVSYANEVGSCFWSLNLVKSLEAETYRDTRGVSAKEFHFIIEKIQNPRDFAIFRLLWDCGLRRGELASLDWQNVDLNKGEIKIRAKGKIGFTTIPIPISSIQALKGLGVKTTGPVYLNRFGRALSDRAIYTIVKKYGDGLRPHQIRHSVITALLEMTNGNTKKVQDFSRHKSSLAIAKYDDNREQNHLQLVNLASGLI